MPFLTEKIYVELYNNDESIMISEWPRYDEKFNFEEEEKQIEKLKSIIVGIRNVRNKMNVHPSRKSKLIFVTRNYKNLIEKSRMFLQKLGFANEINIQDTRENIDSNAISILENDLELFIPFEDLVDIEAEKQRLESEKIKLIQEVERGEKMLSNPGFINKAPESKIQEEKEKLEKNKELLKTVEERLMQL
jgi:valyl-tRNA synthetase